MRALQVIACCYGSSVGVAAACDASAAALLLLATTGVLHALIASHHGISIARRLGRFSDRPSMEQQTSQEASVTDRLRR